jgi:hypothetical protein
MMVERRINKETEDEYFQGCSREFEIGTLADCLSNNVYHRSISSSNHAVVGRGTDIPIKKLRTY